MRICIFLAVAAVLCTTGQSRADKKGPPTTRKVVTSNGKFVFVMLAPQPLEEELKRYGAEKSKEEVKTIRETYPKSGMYKNDGSNEPLWTVDWHAPVTVLPDGIHLIRHGQPTLEQARNKAPVGEREVTEGDLKQEAISIFAKGKLVREFKVADFVDDRKAMRKTVTMLLWAKERKVYEESLKMEVVTNDGNRVLIDIAEGKIIEKKSEK